MTHRPVVLANAVAGAGIPVSATLLRAGACALDAVEAGIRPVERDPLVDSVGVGGLPNLLGEVELDASIMDGKSRCTGAVGALKGIPHPISVARQVMERLPHVLLVGEGAARFARECGAEPGDTLTAAAEAKWREWLDSHSERATGQHENLIALARRSAQAVGPQSRPENTGGTTTFLVWDAHGDCAAGVSTSGWAYKYPGRLGDSPIIGAGCYADNRYGLAACTGQGELTMRACTAHEVVVQLRMGRSVAHACQSAADDLRHLRRTWGGSVTIYALGATGEHYVLGVGDDASASYWYWDDTLALPEERPVHRTDW